MLKCFLARGRRWARLAGARGLATTPTTVAEGVWRPRTDQAQRLKSLEQENSRLKKLVADLSLDNAILRETVSGN